MADLFSYPPLLPSETKREHQNDFSEIKRDRLVVIKLNGSRSLKAKKFEKFCPRRGLAISLTDILTSFQVINNVDRRMAILFEAELHFKLEVSLQESFLRIR